MTNSPLVIREVPYDLPVAGDMINAVQAYYQSIYNGPDRSPVDPAEFSPPSGRFFVGYASGIPVAMGGWRWVDAPPGIGAYHPVEVKRMYVETAVRGKGYARAILSHLESTAALAGADYVVLSTGQPQQDAIALYRSAGYVDVPKFGYYAAYDTAVHLGKPLTRPGASGLPPDGTER